MGFALKLAREGRKRGGGRIKKKGKRKPANLPSASCQRVAMGGKRRKRGKKGKRGRQEKTRKGDLRREALTLFYLFSVRGEKKKGRGGDTSRRGKEDAPRDDFLPFIL